MAKEKNKQQEEPVTLVVDSKLEGAEDLAGDTVVVGAEDAEDEEEIEDFEADGAPRGNFQSDEARAAAAQAARPGGAQPPRLAKIEGASRGPLTAAQRAAAARERAGDDKLVKIKPRRSLTRTKIGKDWYQFTANQTCFVPKHVARLLEEKGVL